MRPLLDDLDMAGWAYVVTEYDNLLSTLVEGRLSSRERTKVKRDWTAETWVRLRGLPSDTSIEDAVADALRYRLDHPGDTLAYISRREGG